MENKVGLKKGETRECAESDRKILTQGFILMFHRTSHWQSSPDLLLPSDCLGKKEQPAWFWRQQFPPQPARIWYHLSVSEDEKRHLQGPKPLREQFFSHGEGLQGLLQRAAGRALGCMEQIAQGGV